MPEFERMLDIMDLLEEFGLVRSATIEHSKS
jgi:hypothetical protein